MPIFGTLPMCYAPAEGGHHCSLCNILLNSIENFPVEINTAQQPSTSYASPNNIKCQDFSEKQYDKPYTHKKFAETFSFSDESRTQDQNSETPSKSKSSSQSLPSDDEDGGAITSIKKNISKIENNREPRNWIPVDKPLPIIPDIRPPIQIPVQQEVIQQEPIVVDSDIVTPTTSSSSKNLKRKNDEQNESTTIDSTKKRMRSSKNWTPDNSLVQYDVSTRSMIDECKSTLDILTKNRQEIDRYILAVYNSMESIMHHRYQNLHLHMETYSNSMNKQHELAVKVVENFISSNNNQIPKTDVPSLKVPFEISVDKIIKKISDPTRNFYRDYEEYHEREWETNDLQNQPEIQHLIHEHQSQQQHTSTNIAHQNTPPRPQSNSSRHTYQNSSESLHQETSTRLNQSTQNLDQSSIKLESSPPEPNERCYIMEPGCSVQEEPTSSRSQRPDQSSCQSNAQNEIDYEKLALIRKALQHPDGITSSNALEIFEKLKNPVTSSHPQSYDDSHVQQPHSSTFTSGDYSIGSPKSTTSSHSHQQTMQPSDPVINVQRDKFVNNKKNVDNSILKRDNSSDSELEVHLSARSKPSKEGKKRNKKLDNATAGESSSVNIELSSQDSENDSESSDVTKDGTSCGEFHAFHNVTTAVVDTVLITCSSNWRLIAGSQDGTLNEINLLSKNFIRTFTKSTSSVTKLAVDVNQRYLLANFYDKTMNIFSLDDGAILHSRSLMSRVDACCANVELPNVPDSTSTFYLGLANGDILLLNLNGMFITVLTKTRSNMSTNSSGITSICICANKTNPVLIVGSGDNSITIRNPRNGSLISRIAALNHNNPPCSITPYGDQMNCIFSYSMNSFRMHDWKANKGIGVINAPGITCVAKLDKFIAIGDADGAIKVHRIIEYTISPKPVKIYFLSSKSAVTCLSAHGQTLVAGSMDGSVTVISITDTLAKYKCLYGSVPCTLKFKTRLDLVNHIMSEHIIFNEKEKIIQCLWRAYRCRVKFNCEQSRKSIRAHILTHIPD